MREQPGKRSGASGSKAIAIDLRAQQARYRLWLLGATLLAAVSALGIQLIFSH